jgi:hypothetical protein
VPADTAIGEVDAPSIEELAAGRDGNEHRRVAVFGNANDRCSLRSSFRHAFLHRGLNPACSG